AFGNMFVPFGPMARIGPSRKMRDISAVPCELGELLLSVLVASGVMLFRARLLFCSGLLVAKLPNGTSKRGVIQIYANSQLFCGRAERGARGPFHIPDAP